MSCVRIVRGKTPQRAKVQHRRVDLLAERGFPTSIHRALGPLTIGRRGGSGRSTFSDKIR